MKLKIIGILFLTTALYLPTNAQYYYSSASVGSNNINKEPFKSKYQKVVCTYKEIPSDKILAIETVKYNTFGIIKIRTEKLFRNGFSYTYTYSHYPHKNMLRSNSYKNGILIHSSDLIYNNKGDFIKSYHYKNNTLVSINNCTVKKNRIESITTDIINNKIIYQEAICFDVQGKFTSFKVITEDRQHHFSSKNIYDSDGNILSFAQEDKTTGNGSKHSFKYDEFGKKTDKIITQLNGKKFGKEMYLYNNYNELIEIMYLDKNDNHFASRYYTYY